jgi:hypothetical protein
MFLPDHSHDLSTLSNLHPRAANSDGTINSNLSDGAIIIIVLVAAGFSVLLGYSMTRFYQAKNDSDGLVANDEQVRYMREVRQRSARSLGVDRYQARGGDLFERDSGSDSRVEGNGNGRDSRGTKETVYSP